MKKIIVIGAGFSGLSAACYLAREGYEVVVLEKNEQVGGRASVLFDKGFVFDRGPSWYWMPDVFEKFFSDFNKQPSDFYTLIRLDPSYRVVFPDGPVDISADYHKLKEWFESLEKGAGHRLDAFMKEANYKYEVGIGKLVYLPCKNYSELMEWELLKGVMKLDVFKSMRRHVHKYFKHPSLRRLLEFPVLFLGGHSGQIPALYSLMNYADTMLGTWYPMGGMGMIPKAMKNLAESMGVKFYFNEEVKNILVRNQKVYGVLTSTGEIPCDGLVASADYHHVEQELLDAQYRKYHENYWNRRVMAPSSLLFYVGLNRKIEGLTHHTLFFDEDMDVHIGNIYKSPAWPERPLFYLSAPSVTDPLVAPEGKENLFMLIPVASGLNDIGDYEKNKYYHFISDKILKHFSVNPILHTECIYSFSIDDFKRRYNAFRGNAYGLANTLLQTAHLKPSPYPKRIRNMVYCGQLTIPGPGVPPALVSGKLAAMEIKRSLS